MNITLFGLTWLVILLIAFYLGKARYIVGVTLFSMVFQSSSVIVIGDNGVGPQIVTSFAMIVWSVIKSPFIKEYKIRFSRNNVTKQISVLALIGFVLVICISRKINIESYSMTRVYYILIVMQLIIYMLCFVSLWNISRGLNEIDIQKIIYSLIIFVVTIGVIQFLTTINLLPKNTILETFIYTKDTYSAYYWTSYYPRVFATFMEPSYCGSFLVGAFYYLISFGTKDRKTIILSLIVVTEIILSFSSTAYGAFAITGVIYLVLSKNKKALKYLIPIGVMCVLMLIITGYFTTILNDVILKKENTGSYYTRHHWDLAAQIKFNSSPLFGTGYKNVRGSQFMISMVAQVGIIGGICWSLIWIPIIVKEWCNRNNKMCIAAGLFLVGTLTALFIAVPDIDFIVFWLALYINAITLGVFERVQKENICEE